MTAVTADVAPAPSRPRSRLGIVGFVIVIVAIVAPIVAGIVAVVAGVHDGSLGDEASRGGWAVIGGFFFWGIAVAFVSPLTMLGTALGFGSLFARTRRRGFGIAAFALGVLPAVVGLCLLPLAWPLVFS